MQTHNKYLIYLFKCLLFFFANNILITNLSVSFKFLLIIDIVTVNTCAFRITRVLIDVKKQKKQQQQRQD
jgi:hypothetical protein